MNGSNEETRLWLTITTIALALLAKLALTFGLSEPWGVHRWGKKRNTI